MSQKLLTDAESTDTQEDNLYGQSEKGDRLPEPLRKAQTRLAKIKKAKQALEDEAHQQAEQRRAGYEAKKKKWDNRKERRGGRPPKAPSDRPDDKRQRNFTDPDSRIMKDGATRSFERAVIQLPGCRG